MSTDYKVVLAFGIRSSDVKSGPSINALYNYIEEGEEWEEAAYYDKNPPEPTEEQVKEFKSLGLEFVKMGDTNQWLEYILSPGPANWSQDIYEDPLRFRSSRFVVDFEWLEKLKRAQAIFGIELSQEPAWHLGGEVW